MPQFGKELQGIPGSSPNWLVASLGGGHLGRKHLHEPDVSCSNTASIAQPISKALLPALLRLSQAMSVANLLHCYNESSLLMNQQCFLQSFNHGLDLSYSVSPAATVSRR